MFNPDDFDDDMFGPPQPEPLPGDDRKQDAPWPVLFQDAMATSMWRIMNDAEAQGLLMDMFTNWDREKMKVYGDTVNSTYQMLGAQPIDYTLLDN
jgi:hypothetical protein